MQVLLRIATLVFGLVLGVQALAQVPAQPNAEGDAARALAELLQDEAAREALIAQLLATAEAAGHDMPDAAAEEPEQMSLARQIAELTSEIAENATGFISAIGTGLVDLYTSLTGVDRPGWAELSTIAVDLGAVIIVTMVLFLALRAIGRRIFRAMSARANGGRVFIQLLRLLGSSLIDAAMVLIAWGGGYVFALAFGLPGTVNFMQSLFLNAFLLVEMAKVIQRAIFSPNYGKLRIASMTDETAAYWYFWVSRLTSLLGYGLLLVVPVINAALSFSVGQSLGVLIGLTALLIAVLIILQNRAQVRAALSARRLRDPNDLIGRVEAMIGLVWHWMAIVYLTAFFLIWAARPGDALQFVALATLNSAIAIVIGVVVTAVISRAIAGGMRLPADIRRTLPLLEVRLNLFVPTILKVVRIIVALAVLVAIAQAWQVLDVLGWLGSEIGRDVAARLFSVAVIVLVAVVAWLATSSFIEYRLNPEVGRIPTARERTLLALFRNAFMIALIIIGSMLALSELGVNIAPLLAGAGVLGLAIGFGAQKLVQDIITGAFIQFENAMNEGDVVTAGGTTGVVESLTIRSVGLRDVAGTYHIIPFSSVDSVSNFMKGFAYHVAEIGVAYRENISEVRELMHKAYDILAQTDLGPHLLEPLDIQGVSSLGESSVVVRGRIKTVAGTQWVVGRAYNEIIKNVLDEAGVEIPFPHMTIYMGQDKDGSAAPLNLRKLKDAPSSPAAAEPRPSSDPAEQAERVRPELPASTDTELQPPSEEEAGNT